jgi:hypothetical protein
MNQSFCVTKFELLIKGDSIKPIEKLMTQSFKVKLLKQSAFN